MKVNVIIGHVKQFIQNVMDFGLVRMVKMKKIVMKHIVNMDNMIVYHL